MSDDEKRKERASLLLEIDDAERTEADLKDRISSAQMAYQELAAGLNMNEPYLTRLDDGRFQTHARRPFDVPDVEDVVADAQHLKTVRASLAGGRGAEHQMCPAFLGRAKRNENRAK